MAKKATAGDDTAQAERLAAPEWLLADKHRRLLPTPWLTPYEFEEFVERLLWAQRHLGPQVRHVARVDRWGSLGEKQDGIDLEGEFNDGVSAVWQCKHLDKLRPFEVKGAVDAMTYPDAEEHCLVFSRVASTQARTEMKNHRNWTLVDRRRLTAMLRELPPQAQKDVLDQTWGADVRRMFLESPGDAFVSIERFVKARNNPDAIANDLGEMVGREAESETLLGAFDLAAGSRRQVVVVSGPAGRGKSRLVSEVLKAARPGVPVVCLAEGRHFTTESLQELWMGPQVVFVDDAHRSPAALATLLSMARNSPDVQVVLATRPSGRSGVVEQIALAEFGPSERLIVDVGSLSTKDSRRLVDGLTEGMSVSFGLKNYLAQQAEHSPFVAVITANMIRRGELSGHIGLNSDLRVQVLSRYTELLGADVEGFSRATTQRVLATLTAIGPVRFDDNIAARVAKLCGIKTIDLVALRSELRDNGVLLEEDGLLRVVPDHLADYMLEEEAAHEEFASEFVGELWDAFGHDHHRTLAPSLGELDWRLAHRGGPRIMTPVWKSIRNRMLTPFYGRIVSELGQLEELAATQPSEVVALLEELRVRLAREDVDGVETPTDPKAPSWRPRFGLPPESRDDVRAKMANLYSSAAFNDPRQLETALDALWDLRRRDSTPTNSNTDHPERMITERLANLATIPHGSFPDRVVAKVAEWASEPSRPDDAVTPLFALAPLLAKELLETVQASTRTLQFEPHTINANKMRQTRDDIREVLLAQALSSDLRRVGAALRLLQDALRQPHGYFGQSVSQGVILSWEDDDLATIDVLTQIAAKTPHPAVRRQVREKVAWNAEHAASPPVRHAALTLVVHLDTIAVLEDDVADHVLNNHFGLGVDKMREVPSLDELIAQRTAEQRRLERLTAEQREAEKNERIHDKVQQRRASRDQQLADVASRLLAVNDITTSLRLLDETARAVQALKHGDHITAWGIWHHLAVQGPDHLGTIITTIAANDPGPLDQDLYMLMGRWLVADPDAAMAWILESVSSGRREVRLAVAQGFSNHEWHDRGDTLTQAWITGTSDDDPDVAQAFLGASGALLKADLEAAVEELLGHDISQSSAVRALESACDYDGRPYGTGLTMSEASSVLRLVELTGYDSYVVQEIVVGIAATYPAPVLDHLAALYDRTQSVPDDIHDLRDAYDANAEVLATWVKEHLDNQGTGFVLEAAANEHLTRNQADALAGILTDLNGDEIQRLVEHLSYLSTWAVEHLALAHAITTQARATKAHERTRPYVADAMRPSSWGTVNGHSTELESAMALATDAATNATDDELKVDYAAAANRLRKLIDQEKKEEDDW